MKTEITEISPENEQIENETFLDVLNMQLEMLYDRLYKANRDIEKMTYKLHGSIDNLKNAEADVLPQTMSAQLSNKVWNLKDITVSIEQLIIILQKYI